jgi:DNA polymerase
MDKRLHQELAAWLEFYRELGIEDFYRRSPGSVSPKGQTPVTASETRPVAPPKVPTEASSSRVVATQPGTTSASVSPPTTAAAVFESAAHPTRINPPTPSLSLFDAPHAPRPGPETLERVREDLGDCHRCKLAEGRKTIVFGEGNPRAALVFVGEGPGADEDEQGRPFVGRAGQLLNRMIQMIGMKREEVYICNVVKCRPPGNRTPERDEVETCSPFLFRQIEAIRPRLICCLGAPAMRTVLGITEGITRVRGRFFDYSDTKAFVTFHTAYILRNPREERILREDFEKIRQFLSSRS